MRVTSAPQALTAPGAAAVDTTSGVTVVIPVWGPVYAGPLLDGALDSIRAQDVGATIIVVDNATEPPIERSEATVIRCETRLTLGEARGVGIASASTAAVMLWDADDVMLPGTLRRLLTALEQDPRLVACATSIIDGRTGRRHHWPRRWPLMLRWLPLVFAATNVVTSLFPTVGALVRTSEARAIRLPAVDAGDDWALGVALTLRGRIGVDPYAGRLYRRRDDSLSAPWSTRDARASAALVRRSLQADPACPEILRRLTRVLCLAQFVVLTILRPLSRRSPRRRREGA